MLVLKRDALSLVAYFESPPMAIIDLIKKSQELASRILGNIPIRTWVAQKRGDCVSEIEVKITDCKALEQSATPPDNLRYTAWNEPPDRNQYKNYGVIEYDWYLDYDPDPVSLEHLGSYLNMTFVVSRFPKEQIERISQVAIDYARLVASVPEFCSGLFDVGDYHEISHGAYYSAAGIGWVNAQRQLARQYWIRSGENRKHMARGVFWGNLYGPRMIQTLGGEQFIRGYQEMERGKESGLCIELPRGSWLILLSRNCRTLMYQPTPIYYWRDRGAWLHKRLMAAGLLC